MNIFSSLRQRKLSADWEYRTQGILWRLLPGPDYLAGEDRNENQHTVSFFCLDDKTGAVRWNNVTFEERWWISIESVHGDVIFFHQFARPDMPEHKQVIAADGATGRTLWMKEEYKFLFAHEDCVYATKELFEGRIVVELDLRTGNHLREFKDQTDYVNVLRETAAARNVTDVHFPGQLSEPAETRGHLPASGGYEYLELVEEHPYRVLAYYENKSSNPGEPLLEQHLKIIDTERDSEVFSDVLAKDARALVPDMFFVRSGTLFFIKNRNTLKAIRLI